MDSKFNSYEYHMIKKFSSVFYSRECSVLDMVKMCNKTSVWHELLTYLLSPDGIMSIYKLQYTSCTENSKADVLAYSWPNCLVCIRVNEN